VIIGRHAEAELFELLDYVQAQSPRNASLVAERIAKEVERIARHPEVRAPEPDVPGLPAGAIGRRATVSGYTIRWVYPFVVDGEPNVLVVSIRRGSRKALDDPAYLLRWLEEAAVLYMLSTSSAGSSRRRSDPSVVTATPSRLRAARTTEASITSAVEDYSPRTRRAHAPSRADSRPSSLSIRSSTSAASCHEPRNVAGRNPSGLS